MDFSRLPDHVFVQTISYLPLKEQLRTGVVNSQFRRISQFAIAGTKSLEISNGGIFNDRFTPLSLVKLMQLCAGSLKEIRFELGDQQHEKEYIGAFTEFQCPNLAKFQGGVGENDILNSVLTQNVNLKTLIVKARITDYPNITSGNLETLECECDEGGLRSLAGRLPNLAHFEVRAVFGESLAALDQFLGTVPNLETLKIETIENTSFKLEQMRLDAFWRLERLSELQIEDGPVSPGDSHHIGDDTFVKVARCFPRLRVLALPADEVTDRGLIALSSLGDLQVLALDYSYILSDLEPQLRTFTALGRLRGLRQLHFAGYGCVPALLFGDLLRELLVSCPHLSEVSLCNLTSSMVDWFESFVTPVTAAEITAVVGALAVAGNNRPPIRITFNTDKDLARHIWRSDEVIEALEKLKVEHGVKVEFRWPLMPVE